MSTPAYPFGAYAVALLLLRLSIAGVLTGVSLKCDSASSYVSIISAVLACMTAGGFLTRAAASAFAVATVAAIAFRWVSPIHVTLIMNAIAIALLGPGAWSVDAFRNRFGILSIRDRTTHDR